MQSGESFQAYMIIVITVRKTRNVGNFCESLPVAADLVSCGQSDTTNYQSAFLPSGLSFCSQKMVWSVIFLGGALCLFKHVCQSLLQNGYSSLKKSFRVRKSFGWLGSNCSPSHPSLLSSEALSKSGLNSWSQLDYSCSFVPRCQLQKAMSTSFCSHRL